MANASTTTAIPNAGTMEENLTCFFCKEVQDEPITLPCDHSYCSVCLQNIVDKRQEKKGKVIESFPCPECRTPFVLKVQKLCETSDILKGEQLQKPQQRQQLQQLQQCQQHYARKLIEWVDKNFQWRLCYRATKDGWNARDFHKKCDNKPATLVLISVNQYIAGGYTDQYWNDGGENKSDKSFLFSLKNKDELPAFQSFCKKDQCAIDSYHEYGPSFGTSGRCDLFISGNSPFNDESFTNFGHSYHLPPGYSLNSFPSSDQLLFGSRNFRPSEIEVFY